MCYKDLIEETLEIIKKHLVEVKRVLEVFDQFQPVLKGIIKQKVSDFIDRAKRNCKERVSEKEFAFLIKELRGLQVIARQLPTVIFFPMFEVGVGNVTSEIQLRLQQWIDQVFGCYEDKVVSSSQLLCQKYEQFSQYLGKVL